MAKVLKFGKHWNENRLAYVNLDVKKGREKHSIKLEENWDNCFTSYNRTQVLALFDLFNNVSFPQYDVQALLGVYCENLQFNTETIVIRDGISITLDFALVGFNKRHIYGKYYRATLESWTKEQLVEEMQKNMESFASLPPNMVVKLFSGNTEDMIDVLMHISDEQQKEESESIKTIPFVVMFINSFDISGSNAYVGGNNCWIVAIDEKITLQDFIIANCVIPSLDETVVEDVESDEVDSE